MKSLSSKSKKELISEETDNHIWLKIDQVLKGDTVSFESKRQTRNGKEIYLHVNYIPHLDQNGKVDSFFASYDDISARKRKENRNTERLTDLKDLLEKQSIEIDHALANSTNFNELFIKSEIENMNLKEELNQKTNDLNYCKDQFLKRELRNDY